ncbi:MAG TPA: hypothetical protein VF488_09580, partial [Gemmatimonadaceae bacterium]
RSLDALGGLLRRWPVVGSALVIGAAAIASLPGLSVFTSEWLLLRALFVGALEMRGPAQVAMLASIGVLAFTGGVAVVCFARLVGIGLLGTSRTPAAADAPPPGWAMRLPLLALAAACVVIAAVPGRVAATLAAAVLVVAPAGDVATAQSALQPVAVLLPLVVGVSALILALRGVVARTAPRVRGATWRCGYATPTAAMQYTSTSFSEPLTRVLEPLLQTKVRQERVATAAATRAWPLGMRWASHTADVVLARIYQPLFAMTGRAASRLRRLHQARVTTWLLYIVATVLVLLAVMAVRPS